MCDKVRYSDDMTVLEEYPSEKDDYSFAVPDSVTEIGDFAFRECISLYGVRLSDSLEKIGAEITTDYANRVL